MNVATLRFSVFFLSFISITATSPTLSAETCDLYRDPQRISHIRATTLPGLYSCFGYLHGSERGWQMDFFRRTVQGRKSEIFGQSALTSDFTMRLLGLYERAQSLYQSLKTHETNILEAYTKGVNKGLAIATNNSYEFKEFGYEPEPWQPWDTLAIILLQSFSQTRRSFEQQLKDQEHFMKFGDQAKDLFALDGLPWSTSILKAGELEKNTKSHSSFKKPTSPSMEQSPVSTNFDDHFLRDSRDSDLDHSLKNLFGSGSNNWAVSKEKSKSKKALLANDPHLSLTRPAFWYWVHLKSENTEAMGATFPGVPLILSGTNMHVSWGLTNSYINVTELNFIDSKDLNQTISHRPVIWIKLGFLKVPFFFKTFQRTSHGHPILPLPAVPKGKALVFKWTGLDLKASDIEGLFEMIHAKSVEEMDTTQARFGVPSWNFVFADTKGDIGYRTTGRAPKIINEPPLQIPTQPLSAIDTPTAFSSLLSSDEMPHLLKPNRHFVATANNLQMSGHTPIFVGRGHATSFRAFRIEELLQKQTSHSFSTFKDIQCDLHATDARFLNPLLVSFLKAYLNPQSPPLERQALELLEAWDFQTDSTCQACGLYRRWVMLAVDNSTRDISAFYRLLVQDPLTDSLKQILKNTFIQAVRDTTNPSGPFLPWQDMHLNSFRHLAGPQFFVQPPIFSPGDEHTVNVGTALWNENSFAHTDGPSHRLIVEMSSPPKIYLSFPGTNEDENKLSLNDPKGPWIRWSQCRYTEQQFPISWENIPLQKTELSL